MNTSINGDRDYYMMNDINRNGLPGNKPGRSISIESMRNGSTKRITALYSVYAIIPTHVTAYCFYLVGHWTSIQGWSGIEAALVHYLLSAIVNIFCMHYFIRQRRFMFFLYPIVLGWLLGIISIIIGYLISKNEVWSGLGLEWVEFKKDPLTRLMIYAGFSFIRGYWIINVMLNLYTKLLLRVFRNA